MLENKKNADFGEWFLELVQKAELMDYAPVQGCMAIRERAYSVWEKIQGYLDPRFKQDGVKNAYFPLLIPESLLQKEAEHFAGFVPEVAWVTQGGNETLGERLALRPTSETIMYAMFSKWISSHRDLPLKINQWCNIIRWDTKTLKPFLRTREFLWQEGHTAHASKGEAETQVTCALEWYRALCEDLLAIPVYPGVKSEAEKFPGAEYTTAIEALMPDGKALQCGTSHLLGQNFAKIFDIKFKDKSEKEDYAWQTSWGVSTRLLGALAAIHGDDKGLVLPPRVAPLHVVVVPIYYSADERKMGLLSAQKLKTALEARGVIVHVDDREERTPGFKFNDWELKGVPVRVEVGVKELARQGVTIARRDTGVKEFITDDKAVAFIETLLENIQKNLFERAKAFLVENTRGALDFNEFKSVLENKKGFIKTGWCLDARCEEALKEESGATVRLIPFGAEGKPEAGAKCVYCGKPAKVTALFAKSY
ncbi:proline--tRNA ligase [Candidatus Micrarchaeota archaeon]|nr:proline--tRNA ligase [Candidatus Micrarchaeota archaeon]